MSSVNAISFGSNYLIPFNQVKDSSTMRSIGAESAKYVKNQEDISQTKDGIVVKVDDAKDKEYEAVVAKYGVNIQKYEGKFPENVKVDENSYEYMVSKLHPEDAQAKIEAYKKMDEAAKDKEFLNIYKEFKGSNFSVEHLQQANLPKPKLTPTDKPIIKFTDKAGEKFMAREVKLETGDTCMAVSNEKNPSQATLMNKEEFFKYFAQNCKQV
jgi:hypothetical protein